MSALPESIVSALPTTGRRRTGVDLRVVEIATYLVVVVAVVLVGASTSGFFSLDNLRSMIASVAFVGIVAIGLTPIVISGSLFSLTLGTTTAMSAVLFVGTIKFGLGWAILLTVSAGTLVGVVQGWLVGALNANPIIVTIAAGSLQAGGASWATEDATMYPPAGYSGWSFLSDTVAGIPFSAIVMVVFAVVLGFAMAKTTWGKSLYLIGDNRRAAYSAGLPVTGAITGAFAVASFGAALAGVLLAAFSQNATTQIGGTLSFDAIAAVLVGGTAIAGGRGSIARTVFGACVIVAISNLLLLRGQEFGVRTAASGVLVLFVVAVVHLRQRIAAR